ncbi:MAG TPA: type II toxin-antitoxin system VapC family toxin [Terriglobales bacterium]|nr:type II toxin-antitoxin system VapC family toxin [Terriglobales bacterium]
MRPALLDASIYITALRTGDDATLSLRNFASSSPIWLSAVVLQELYAGTLRSDIHIMERLERDFEAVRRVLVPNIRDWTRTGRILSRMAEKYGHQEIGKKRLIGDALIATSAGRLGITVITANERDFSKLAEFDPFDWRVLKLS